MTLSLSCFPAFFDLLMSLSAGKQETNGTRVAKAKLLAYFFLFHKLPSVLTFLTHLVHHLSFQVYSWKTRS